MPLYRSAAECSRDTHDITSVQISCQPAGLTVLDGLGLGSCSPGSHSAVYSGLSGAKLSLAKCESCLPPCDDKKYEFKVCSLGFKDVNDLSR